MKSKLGIHYPNANFRGMDRLDSIAWNAFTVLHLDRNHVPEMRAKYPDALILVRPYLDNWYQTDPREWAREIAGWWKDVSPFTKHLTWANEQNLANEGHPLAMRYRKHPRNQPLYLTAWGSRRYHPFKGALSRALRAASPKYPQRKVYEDIAVWNMVVIKELRRLIPDAILHFPALSQGHSDDQNDAGYVGYEILRPAVDACDYLDVHTYWNGAANRESEWYGRRYERLRALFPNKPMFISECGSDVDMQHDDGADYIAWLNGLPDYVEGAAFFIWDSDAANTGWTIWDKLNIVDALRKYAAMPPSPAMITLEETVKAVASQLSWMPINTDAALYKIAQKHGLGCPQADEKEFLFNGVEWLFQVFQGGIVYVKKGDWGDVKWITKSLSRAEPRE